MVKITQIILQGVARGIVPLLAVSVIVFSAVELLPGDLAQQVLGQSATPETVVAFRQELGPES